MTKEHIKCTRIMASAKENLVQMEISTSVIN